MAISMVRQPSETPNVTNLDDIIPFRYAYGDQNGYVIGKGQELSYTINGRDFRVNSGRVVLNGVESDVDANGVTFTIDNASETRYYVVYYQVNLATNTTDILLSNFSTTGYPVIDIGDDLTTNPSGLARMELYRFTTSNGVIGNVEKVIKAIEYTKNIFVENSRAVNNLEIKQDENGRVIFNNNYTIPYEIELYSGELSNSLTEDDNDIIVTLPSNMLHDNKTYRIEGSLGKSYFQTYITKLNPNINDTMSNSNVNAGFTIHYAVQINESVLSSVSILNVVVVATTEQIRFHTFYDVSNTRPLRSGFTAKITRVVEVVR